MDKDSSDDAALEQEISSKFHRIKISSFDVLLDPVFNFFCRPVTNCLWNCLIRGCKQQTSKKPMGCWYLRDYLPCEKREKAYDKVVDRLTDELEITNILNMLRDLKGITEFLKGQKSQ